MVTSEGERIITAEIVQEAVEELRMAPYRAGYNRGVANTAILAGALIFIGGLGMMVKHNLKKEDGLAVKVENVIGETTPDRFVDKNGQRLYLKIDGRPAIEYFRNQ